MVINLDNDSAKILGLRWHPGIDVISFSIQLPPIPTIFTKRNILSEVAQIYDPIGIISPVVIKAKILLQELWLLKFTWDEQVPISIEKKWLAVREDFYHLNEIQLPRWLGLKKLISGSSQFL